MDDTQTHATAESSQIHELPENAVGRQGNDKSFFAQIVPFGVREGDETCRGAQLRSFVCLPPPREHFCLLRDKKGEGEHTSCP